MTDYLQNGFTREDAQKTLHYLNHSNLRWDKLHEKLAKKKAVSKSDLKELGKCMDLSIGSHLQASHPQQHITIIPAHNNTSR